MQKGFVTGHMVNPVTRLSMGGLLDILSMANIHGVKISVSYCEEGEYYVLSVSKGNCVEKRHISNSELDAARNDEQLFRIRLRYAIYNVLNAYEFEKEKREHAR